jgi:type I restriction enzyme S subunit
MSIYKNFIEYIKVYWFVQFDFPNSEGKPYKSSGGKMVWNDEYKSEVPEKWLTSNLYENKLTDIIQPGVVYFNSKNYLATANVVDSNIKDGDWVTFENRESRANMQPVENSVWFAKMKNSIKHITITDADNWILNKYIFSTGFFGLKCTPEALGYMHSIINSNQFEFIKNRLAHGATQEAVNNNDLKSMNIIVPSTDILLKYNRIVLPLIKKMNNNRYENDQLTRLKDFLLPILMNN